MGRGLSPPPLAAAAAPPPSPHGSQLGSPVGPAGAPRRCSGPPRFPGPAGFGSCSSPPLWCPGPWARGRGRPLSGPSPFESPGGSVSLARRPPPLAGLSPPLVPGSPLWRLPGPGSPRRALLWGRWARRGGLGPRSFRSGGPGAARLRALRRGGAALPARLPSRPPCAPLPGPHVARCGSSGAAVDAGFSPASPRPAAPAGGSRERVASGILRGGSRRLGCPATLPGFGASGSLPCAPGAQLDKGGSQKFQGFWDFLLTGARPGAILSVRGPFRSFGGCPFRGYPWTAEKPLGLSTRRFFTALWPVRCPCKITPLIFRRTTKFVGPGTAFSFE